MAILNDLIVSGPTRFLSDVTISGNVNLLNSSPNLQISNSSGGDVSITLDRTANANWRILNSSGDLKFQNDWTSYKTNYFDVMKLSYNTGNVTIKGSVTAPTFVGSLSGTASHTSAGGYCTASDYSSGYYKIKINSTAAWMLNFTIKVYQGYRADDIQISGYNYGANHWYSPSARLIASSHADAQTVYFGYDSNYNLWVGIPASSYTGIEISEVCNGYEKVASWTDLFTITYQSSLTGTIQTTQTIYRPWYRNEKPSYTYSEVGAAPAYTYQTTDPGAGSTLTTGKLLIVYS